MADENENGKSDSKDESSQTCPLCGGTGKLCLNCNDDDTDIYSSAVRTMICPLCRGRGKVRHYSLRHMRIRLRPRPNRMLLRRRRPSSSRGRGGKFSRSHILLLPPCTPVSGWPDGDLIPKSSPESAYLGEDIDYTIVRDDENPREGYPGETILRFSDNITLTLGKEFPPNLVLDTRFIDTNFQEAFEARQDLLTAQITYGRQSDEYFEWLLHEIDPFKQPAIIQLEDELYAVVGNKGQFLDLEPYEVHTETHISEYNAGLQLDIENEPARELTLQPHQSTSATFTDVLGPDVAGEGTSLDITADVEDPIGFDVNTDIVGNTW